MKAATVVQVLQDFEAPPTIAPLPPTIVANPHIDRSLGSKETHIQSHNRNRHARRSGACCRRNSLISLLVGLSRDRVCRASSSRTANILRRLLSSLICLYIAGHASGLYHRLNGSSSPVLTATCLSYGRLCDFLGFFSRTDLEVTPLDRF